MSLFLYQPDTSGSNTELERRPMGNLLLKLVRKYLAYMVPLRSTDMFVLSVSIQPGKC